MAATVKVYYFNGAGPSGADAESGIKFNRADTINGTTPIPIPTATGTNYSWYKALALYCTSGGGTTSSSNLKVKLGSAITTGLKLWWNNFTTDTYAQASDVASPANPANDDAPDSSLAGAWTEITTSDGTYDATGGAFTNSAKSGKYCVVALGVGNNYVGGAGSAIALPNLVFTYDEA